MKLEVIIPAYKPDSELKTIIEKLNIQELKPDLITVLLTSDSNFEIEELQKNLGEEVRVMGIPKIRFSHGGTRQAGMDMSDADYVMFMTQDAVPKDNQLTLKLYEALQKPDAAVAYARQVPKKDADEIEKFSRRYNYPKKSRTQSAIDIERTGIKAIFCSDSCAMYDHRLHKEIGGFDVDADFNEDSIFAYHALMKGYTVEYCAEAKVYHSHNLTLKQQFVRNRNIAAAHKKYSEIYGSIKSENEGVRYFLTGSRYFLSKHQYRNCFKLFLVCAVRFIGYKTGKLF